LAERCRAAPGILLFYSCYYGTEEVAEGKEVREFNGKMHVMELVLRLILLFKSLKGDTQEI
jgi:3-oxoacid CoA-transferase subunit A